MADVTVIGRGTHVRGRIAGDGDLEIHGHVEGDVNVQGELLVETHGLVAANLKARRMVVRGAVKGDLTADEAILLEQGARVVGDIRAPRVSVGQGAMVRGYVQTGEASAPSRAKAAQPAARATISTASASAPKAAARVEPARHQAHQATVTAISRGATLAGAAPARRGPPAPVVPALKKGAKGALKKKA